MSNNRNSQAECPCKRKCKLHGSCEKCRAKHELLNKQLPEACVFAAKNNI